AHLLGTRRGREVLARGDRARAPDRVQLARPVRVRAAGQGLPGLVGVALGRFPSFTLGAEGVVADVRAEVRATGDFGVDTGSGVGGEDVGAVAAVRDDAAGAGTITTARGHEVVALACSLRLPAVGQRQEGRQYPWRALDHTGSRTLGRGKRRRGRSCSIVPRCLLDAGGEA